MEPSSRSRARPWTPLSHHHHHHHPLIVFPNHHHLFLCPHHNHNHHLDHHHHHHHNHLNCYGHVSASPALLPPPNPQQMSAAPLQNESALFKYSTDQYHGTRILQQQEHWGLEEAEAEAEAEEDDVDDDEEPIFVLTDEWREFFAKSEAKRRLEKKQAKRK